MNESIAESRESITEFTESYASFNRIINNLQRQYIDLKEEFSEQNQTLADTNKRLIEMTRRNLTANETLNSILNSITAGIIAVDQSGKVTHFNPAASLLYGIPEREPLGKSYRDIIPPGNPYDANALRAVETGREVDEVEKEIELDDGTRLSLTVSTAIIRDSDGIPNGAVEVLHDLTKMKKMESELARLNTLAALGEMAATIAHQVRNPLAAISGFAGLLKRDLESDDPRQKLVTKICQGADNLDATVTALLNYTRIEEVKKEEVVYDDFLRQTVQKFKYDNSELIDNVDISLEPTYGPDSTPVKVVLDPILVRQSFFNLFANAIQASGGSGKIEVRYHKLPRQKAVRLHSDRLILGLDETVVETVVVDGGPGIPEKSLDKLFTPFFTTTRNGTGLGLAVVWKVLKSHGGEIVADNAPEGGARFVMLMPTRIDQGQADGSDGDD